METSSRNADVDEIRRQLLAEQEVLRSLRRAASSGHETQQCQADSTMAGGINPEQSYQQDGFFSGRNKAQTSGIKLSENRYKMDHAKMGQCIILHSDSTKPKSDVALVEKCFQNLGFAASKAGTKNMSPIAMQSVVEKSLKAQEQNFNCFVMAFLMPGHYLSSEVTQVLSTVLEPVKTCKALFGKPKIIIVQVAEELYAGEVKMQADSVTLSSAQCDNIQPKKKIPKEADFLYIFSTPQGRSAYRYSSGSCFLQVLCSALGNVNTCRSQEVHQILTRVNRDLYINYGKKQVASFASMLTKELYIKH